MLADELATFFSYCREDSDFALRLAGDLKGAGAHVWLDQLDIVPGQRWDRAVEDALAHCRSILVILSPASVSSTNVMDEVSFALEENKTVIPVIYKDCAIPFRLRRVQYVDCRQNYNRGLAELLKTLAPTQKPTQSAAASIGLASEPPTHVTEADKREHTTQEDSRKATKEQRQASEQARFDKERKVPAVQSRPEDEPNAPQKDKDKLKAQVAKGLTGTAKAGRDTTTSAKLTPSTTPRRTQARPQALKINKELVRLSHEEEVRSVAWSPDGKQLVTASVDNTVNLWDVATGRALLKLSLPGYIFWSVGWSPDGKWLATGSGDKKLGQEKDFIAPGEARIWDAGSGKQLLTLSGHEAVVYSVAWNPDGAHLATGSWDNTAKVWNVKYGSGLSARLPMHHTLKGHSGKVYCVAWSPEGKRLATASEDTTARIWDLDTCKELLNLNGHRGPVVHVAWSPDGKRLATGSEDATMRVWDAETGREQLALSDLGGTVVSVAWSPGGKQLAIGNDLSTVSLWDIESIEQLVSLTGHRGWVWSVAWSPDGTRLATGGEDGSAKVWDVAHFEKG